MTPPTPLDALDLLATWLETLPQPHVLFDAQYRIVAANSAYQQVFGQDASVLGRCPLFTSPSPRDATPPRMPSSS